jgi:hypothetical protein
MIKRSLVWAAIAAGVLAAAGAARLMLTPRTGTSRASGIPTIGGDTWPPVPLNPNRQV